MSASPSGFLVSRDTNERSIFSASIWNCWRWEREEYPVPKSSIAMRTPSCPIVRGCASGGALLQHLGHGVAPPLPREPAGQRDRGGLADSFSGALKRGIEGEAACARDRQVDNIRGPLLECLAERVDILPELGQGSSRGQRRPRLTRSRARGSPLNRHNGNRSAPDTDSLRQLASPARLFATQLRLTSTGSHLRRGGWPRRSEAAQARHITLSGIACSRAGAIGCPQASHVP